MKKLIVAIIFALFLGACSSSDSYDIVIIGGGLMGSATAWHLANTGEKVLLIEQQDSIYTTGSSYGDTRISRSLGPPGDIYSFLHNQTVSEVYKMIDILNQKNPGNRHSIDEIYTTSPVSYVRHIRQLPRIEKILEGQEDSFAFATTSQMASQLFDADIPDSSIFLREYKDYSGTINPTNLIKKLHLAIIEIGGEIWYNTKVEELLRSGCCYQLDLEDQIDLSKRGICAAKVVSAAGPFTGTLLKDVAPYFEDLINPQRVFLSFIKINSEKYASLTADEKVRIKNGYPVINSSEGTREGSFFSMIEKIDLDEIPVIKIGGHFQRSDIDDLDKVWKKELSDEEIAWGINHTLKYLKTLNIPVERKDLEYNSGYSCVYSLTRSEIPLVTPAIGNDKREDRTLVVLAGMSGVGAKGAMMYGLMASNLVRNIDVNGEMYRKTQLALGYQRLVEDAMGLE